jgi:hypothetical protein
MNSPPSNLAETKALLQGMAAEAEELKQALGGSITDAVAGWLAQQYVLAGREQSGRAEGAGRWEVLRAFAQDWTLLRRGDHSAARLQLEREELELARENRQAQKEKEFREWLKRPEIRKELFPDPTRGITRETIERIERELKLL